MEVNSNNNFEEKQSHDECRSIVSDVNSCFEFDEDLNPIHKIIWIIMEFILRISSLAVGNNILFLFIKTTNGGAYCNGNLSEINNNNDDNNSFKHKNMIDGLIRQMYDNKYISNIKKINENLKLEDFENILTSATHGKFGSDKVMLINIDESIDSNSKSKFTMKMGWQFELVDGGSIDSKDFDINNNCNNTENKPSMDPPMVKKSGSFIKGGIKEEPLPAFQLLRRYLRDFKKLIGKSSMILSFNPTNTMAIGVGNRMNKKISKLLDLYEIFNHFNFIKLSDITGIAHKIHLRGIPNDLLCSICHDLLKNPSLIGNNDCNHTFCNECILSWNNVSPSNNCPLCRREIINIILNNEKRDEIIEFESEIPLLLYKQSQYQCILSFPNNVNQARFNHLGRRRQRRRGPAVVET